MNKLPALEIPAEVREFAVNSVGQARKAFETFVGAAQETAAKSDGFIQIPAGVKELNAKVVSIACANVNAALDHAEKLVAVKDAQEALDLQSSYLKAQIAALQEQAKEIGAAAQDSLKSA